MQAATSGEQETSEAQGPNMQRFVQQLSGKVRSVNFTQTHAKQALLYNDLDWEACCLSLALPTHIQLPCFHRGLLETQMQLG